METQTLAISSGSTKGFRGSHERSCRRRSCVEAMAYDLDVQPKTAAASLKVSLRRITGLIFCSSTPDNHQGQSGRIYCRARAIACLFSCLTDFRNETAPSNYGVELSTKWPKLTVVMPIENLSDDRTRACSRLKGAGTCFTILFHHHKGGDARY